MRIKKFVSHVFRFLFAVPLLLVAAVMSRAPGRESYFEPVRDWRKEEGEGQEGDKGLSIFQPPEAKHDLPQ